MWGTPQLWARELSPSRLTLYCALPAPDLPRSRTRRAPPRRPAPDRRGERAAVQSARWPSREELRERTTVQFAPYAPSELYIGGLTPLLAELFAVSDLGGVNIRFHAYAPSEFAVGGKPLSDVVPRAGQLMKRLAR